MGRFGVVILSRVVYGVFVTDRLSLTMRHSVAEDVYVMHAAMWGIYRPPLWVGNRGFLYRILRFGEVLEQRSTAVAGGPRPGDVQQKMTKMWHFVLQHIHTYIHLFSNIAKKKNRHYAGRTAHGLNGMQFGQWLLHFLSVCLSVSVCCIPAPTISKSWLLKGRESIRGSDGRATGSLTVLLIWQPTLRPPSPRFASPYPSVSGRTQRWEHLTSYKNGVRVWPNASNCMRSESRPYGQGRNVLCQYIFLTVVDKMWYCVCVCIQANAGLHWAWTLERFQTPPSQPARRSIHSASARPAPGLSDNSFIRVSIVKLSASANAETICDPALGVMTDRYWGTMASFGGFVGREPHYFMNGSGVLCWPSTKMWN